MFNFNESEGEINRSFNYCRHLTKLIAGKLIIVVDADGKPTPYFRSPAVIQYPFMRIIYHSVDLLKLPPISSRASFAAQFVLCCIA